MGNRSVYGPLEGHVTDDTTVPKPRWKLPQKLVVLSQYEEELLAIDPSEEMRKRVWNAARHRVDRTLWEQMNQATPERRRRLGVLVHALNEFLGDAQRVPVAYSPIAPATQVQLPLRPLRADVLDAALELVSPEDRAVVVTHLRQQRCCVDDTAALREVTRRHFPNLRERDEARAAMNCDEPRIPLKRDEVGADEDVLV